MKDVMTNIRKHWKIKLSIDLLTLLLCNIDAIVLQMESLVQVQNNRPAPRNERSSYLYTTSDDYDQHT